MFHVVYGPFEPPYALYGREGKDRWAADERLLENVLDNDNVGSTSHLFLNHRHEMSMPSEMGICVRYALSHDYSILFSALALGRIVDLLMTPSSNLFQRDKLFRRRGVNSDATIEILLGRAHSHGNSKSL